MDITQADTVQAIAEWAELWRNPDFAPRQQAQKSTDPFPFAHVEGSLNALLDTLTPAALWTLIDRESVRNAQGVGVVGHVIASNTPLLAWTSVLRALLMRSRSVVKLPSGTAAQWGFWLHESLREAAPALAGSVHMEQWSGADDEKNAQLCSSVDALLAYGSDETVRNLRLLCPPHVRFIGYGHRVSAGLTGENGNADGFARDILVYDGGGCLTPQTIFVLGNAAVFAEKLANALARTVNALPLPTRTAGAALRVQTARALAHMEPETSVFGDNALRWTVIVRPHGEFAAGVGHGVVHVQPVNDWDELPALLFPAAGRLQGVGIGGGADDVPRALLTELGVSYACRAGEMQTPPFGWREDGLDLLACLLP